MRHPSQFGAMVIFAALVSVAFSCLTNRTPAARAKYALYSFLSFLGVAIGIAWLMFFFSR